MTSQSPPSTSQKSLKTSICLSYNRSLLSTCKNLLKTLPTQTKETRVDKMLIECEMGNNEGWGDCREGYIELWRGYEETRRGNGGAASNFLLAKIAASKHGAVYCEFQRLLTSSPSPPNTAQTTKALFNAWESEPPMVTSAMDGWGGIDVISEYDTKCRRGIKFIKGYGNSQVDDGCAEEEGGEAGRDYGLVKSLRNGKIDGKDREALEGVVKRCMGKSNAFKNLEGCARVMIGDKAGACRAFEEAVRYEESLTGVDRVNDRLTVAAWNVACVRGGREGMELGLWCEGRINGENEEWRKIVKGKVWEWGKEIGEWGRIKHMDDTGWGEFMDGGEARGWIKDYKDAKDGFGKPGWGEKVRKLRGRLKEEGMDKAYDAIVGWEGISMMMEGKVKEGIELLEIAAEREGGYINFANLTIALLMCDWKMRGVEVWLGYRGLGRAWKEGRRDVIKRGKEQAIQMVVGGGEIEKEIGRIDCVICKEADKILSRRRGGKK